MQNGGLRVGVIHKCVWCVRSYHPSLPYPPPSPRACRSCRSPRPRRRSRSRPCLLHMYTNIHASIRNPDHHIARSKMPCTHGQSHIDPSHAPRVKASCMTWTPSSLKTAAWPTKCASAELADLWFVIRAYFLGEIGIKNKIDSWIHLTRYRTPSCCLLTTARGPARRPAPTPGCPRPPPAPQPPPRPA